MTQHSTAQQWLLWRQDTHTLTKSISTITECEGGFSHSLDPERAVFFNIDLKKHYGLNHINNSCSIMK